MGAEATRAADAASQIAPGVHRIDLPLGERVSALYLFVGSERAVLFDTGCAGDLAEHVLPGLDALGIAPERVSHVVVSHCDVDHSGGIAAVHAALPGAAVLAHRLDADAMETLESFESQRARSFRQRYGFDEEPAAVAWMRGAAGFGPVDRRLDGGEQIDLGDRALEILHVPGHTPGHLAVHDPATGVLAISDAILGDAVPLRDGSPSFPPTYRFVGAYLATIERVRALAPAQLATAHYGVLGDPQIGRFLDTSRDFAGHLRAAVLDAVAASPGGISLVDLLVTLNPSVGTWPADGTLHALAFPVVGHVEQLVDEGLVRLRSAADGTFVEPVA